MGLDLRVEYTAMGDAVNVAARMEQTAAPGTVQISESTRALVDKLFEFEPLGAMEVKGRSEPVEAHRVIKALPRPEKIRGIEGLDAAMVGRGEQLNRMGDRWAMWWVPGQDRLGPGRSRSREVTPRRRSPHCARREQCALHVGDRPIPVL